MSEPLPYPAVKFLYDIGGDPSEGVRLRREARMAALLDAARAAERERIANLFVPFIHGEMFDETPENALDLDSTAFAIGERFRFLIGAYPYRETP